MLVLVAVAATLVLQGLEANKCQEPLHMGDKKCDKQPSIRYFFDSKRERCFPFMYSGCGGNANNFESSDRCHHSCGFADRISCPGDVPHTGSCHNGSPDGKFPAKTCPKGSSCYRGAFGGGICCDDAISKKVENFDCGNKKVIKEEWSAYGILLGRECVHNFCPSGSDCSSNGYYAYCCK